MKTTLAIILSALFLAGCTTSHTTGGWTKKPCTVPVHTPAKGTAERTAIIDATRAAMEKQDPSRKVVLTVAYLKVHCGWAWIQVNPRSPDGTQNYESQSGLLQETTKGTWKLLEWMPAEEGMDDAKYFVDLRKKYPAAPADIFPK